MNADAYHRTPHDVALLWMTDILRLLRETGCGLAMRDLKGASGALNGGRKGVSCDEYRGHEFDRKMPELRKES